MTKLSKGVQLKNLMRTYEIVELRDHRQMSWGKIAKALAIDKSNARRDYQKEKAHRETN